MTGHGTDHHDEPRAPGGHDGPGPDPVRWRGPHEDEHEQHAGKGTVNHLPEDLDGPPRPGTPNGSSGHRPVPDDLDTGRDRLAEALGGFSGRAGPRPPFADRPVEDEGEPEGAAPPGPGSGGAGPEGPGSGGPGSDGFGSGGPGSDGFGSDELALRRMLHSAVSDVEPRDGTLEFLRQAVPARRARKRQALVGVAAAALFIGTAIPALVHVSNATGSDADPSIAGQASQAQGGVGRGKGPDGGSSGPAGSSGSARSKGKGGQKDKGDTDTGTSNGSAGADPSATAASAAACTAAQLGGATSSVGSPDSTGLVYGTFRVSNISGTSCTVSGAGTVGVATQGAADPAQVTVVSHAAGDAATGLPDPSQELASLILKPGTAYEVRFAWAPSQTCPVTSGGSGGDSGGSSPDPTPTDSTTDGSEGDSTDGSEATTQLLRADGTADGSVTVSLTAATGSPTVTATVSNACAGTVYRTGVLAGS